MSKNKKISNATELEFEGIKFRSKLEVYCYKRLKEEGLSFKYESYTYNLIPTFKYKYKLYVLSQLTFLISRSSAIARKMSLHTGTVVKLE